MILLSTINGKVFEILEDLKHPQSFEQDRIALFQDTVCLLSGNRCYFKEGVEDWLKDTIESKWINTEHQEQLVTYLKTVLNKMTSYRRSQTIYELLDRDNYYNSLILAC